MRKLLLIALLLALGSPALAQNYTATPGTGLTFGSKLVGGVNYPQFVFCDPTTPSQCVAVNASGQMTIANTTFAATQSGTWNIGSITTLPAITGTVTANAGTNLNTSALALETGGNLASINTKTPALGQALAAASVPVVLPATQITTLTPPTTVAVTQGTAANLNATVVGTGTFAVQAAQSGTWTVNPTTAANWGINTLGSTTSGQSGELGLGAVTTGAPTYTTGQSNALSLTTAGALRIDGSNATQPVSGTVTANLGTIAGAALAANQTNGTQKSQIVDGSGNVIGSTSNALNVAITSGGGSGGTASSFGATFPATGTAAGMSQGGNMVALTGTSGNLNVQCANCSGSGVSTADEATFTAGTSLFAGGGGFFQTTATSNALTSGQQGMFQVTANRALFTNLRDTAGAALGVSGNPTFTQLAAGAATIGAISNTSFAATQSGTWNVGSITTLPALVAGSAIIGKVGIDQTTPGTTNLVSIGTNGTVNPQTAANWGIGTSTQNSASVANGHLMLGQFNTTPTTISSGNMSPLQLDNAGNVLVNIKAGSSSGAVAQGSTTSGQSGGLTQAAVTTSAPTYTTGQTNPLSLDTAGNLRVNVTTATGLAQGSTTSGQSGSLVMGAVTTSAPTYTTAQSSPFSLDTAGNLRAQDASTSATAAAVPSKAGYVGANSSGNLTGLISCDSSVVYDASTSGSTQLVALSSGKTIYVCGYALATGATATNVKLIYGTGTACATGSTNLTAAYQLGANSGIVDHSSNFFSGMKSAASNALCINTSAANAVQATVYYTQF